MSLPAMTLLLLVFIAYTPSLTVAQTPTMDQQRRDRMAEWEDRKRFPARYYSDEERAALRASPIRSSKTGIQSFAVEEPALPRSECRFMSRQRWDEYVTAWQGYHFNVLNGTNVSQHQLQSSQHRSVLAPAAHFGPCFLPWHREYLRRWELNMRKHVANTSLCYLDWTLDRWMTNPCDSVTFSPDHFGSHTGDVTTGLAANWNVYPQPDCRGRNNAGTKLFRQCISGSTGKSYLYTEAQINTFINSYTTYGHFCMPDNDDFEGLHGNVHGYVGGTMNSLACSPNDPIFVSHHSNVDRIYQKFRDRIGAASVNQYVNWTNIFNDEYANSTVLPFNDTTPPMKCADGLKMDYDNAIKYEDVPKNCSTQAACGNGDGKGALWCDTTAKKCCAKLKIGGVCTSVVTAFRGIVCYTESRCATNATCTGTSTRTCTCTFKTG